MLETILGQFLDTLPIIFRSSRYIMETRHEALAYSDQDFAHLNLLHRDRKADACYSTQLHFGGGS